MPPVASTVIRSSTVRSSAGRGRLVRVARPVILASVRAYWSLVPLPRKDAITGLLSCGYLGQCRAVHLDDEFLEARG